MKILYYDCFAGISGDMNLAALLHLGVNEEYLIRELHKLSISNEFNIEIKNEIRNGIAGKKVNVVTKDTHNHSNHKNAGRHHHRNYNDIKEIITSSELSDFVKSTSISIFTILGNAEAKVHNTTIDAIHFHEVGAVDSIVDIIGAAICLDYLKVDKIISSPLELGGGTVNCAHGVLPVPAPATAEIVKDVPVTMGKVQKETTTPTGAAIIKATANEFIDNPSLVIKATGYGIGTRELPIPNMLRVFLAEISDIHNKEMHKLQVTECNIDDMNPEFYNYIMEKLFDLGARDVFLTPVTMKKGRPAVVLTILHTEDLSNSISDFIFNETTSIGLRTYTVQKTGLKRSIEKVETQYGTVNVKISFLYGKPIKHKAEYDDCKRLALKHGISLNKIYSEVTESLKHIKGE